MATTLTAGDIALIGFNADNPDAWAFLLLTEVSAGTEITFTDCGWFAAGGFRETEGTALWTASQDLPAGTVVTPDIGSVALSTDGDQIIVYQGDAVTPTLLYAINFDEAGWANDATSSNTSALPAGLVPGETAIALPETDNASYQGPTSGTPAALLGAIGTVSNWLPSDDPLSLPSAPFSLAETPESLSLSVIYGSATVDILRGTSLNEGIWGLGGADLLCGRGGHDRLNGHGGDDVLRGNQGNDHLQGGRGDDRLYGGQGQDTLRGDAGKDILHGRQGNDQIEGGKGRDRLKGQQGEDTLIGGTGDDVLRGGKQADLLMGTDSAHCGQGEIDFLVGGRGQDTFVLGDATQVYYADADPTTSGIQDYAHIEDFQVGRDLILLSGEAQDYSLGAVQLADAPRGTGLYWLGDGVAELIGFLRNIKVTQLNLNHPEHVLFV